MAAESEKLMGINSKYWKEARVNRKADHMLLVYGTPDSNETMIPVALLAPWSNRSRKRFRVEFLPLKDTPNHKRKQLREVVVCEINFFTEELRELKPWQYMIYHATNTASNWYGSVHWLYYTKAHIDKVLSGEQEDTYYNHLVSKVDDNRSNGKPD